MGQLIPSIIPTGLPWGAENRKKVNDKQSIRVFGKGKITPILAILQPKKSNYAVLQSKCCT